MPMYAYEVKMPQESVMLGKLCFTVILFSSICTTSAQLRLGAEFVDRPYAAVNILPSLYGGWLDRVGNQSELDSNGWPTEDAYSVWFDVAPWIHDPEPYVSPDWYGDYSVEFQGKGDIVLGQQLNITLSNVTFDAETWITRAVVTLHPATDGSVPGIALGVFNTQRSPGAPVGTGFTNMRVLQPGYSVWDDSVPFFTSTFLAAVAPLSQLRMMEKLATNEPVPSGLQLQWDGRRQFSDALWGQPSIPRPTALPGVPWEVAVLLAQAVPDKAVWVNMHVAYSGESPDDTSSFIYNVAMLLRNGNSFTGDKGVPLGTVLYIEHGNELWLNGTVGGPDGSYTWNLAAAISEVLAGGSVLNNDGATDPVVWAQRRHLKRLREIRDIFSAVLTLPGRDGSALPAYQVRMVYGWYQNYLDDAEAALQWYASTYPEPPSELLYGLAINGYIPAYPMPTWNPADITTAIIVGSDAARPYRQASSDLVVRWNFTELLAYEGMPLAIPALGNEDNVTWACILETMRSPLIEPVMKYDMIVNWAPLERAGAFNYYGLTSLYGPYPVLTWGLSEDLANTTTPKWLAVKEMLGIPRPVAVNSLAQNI